MQLKKINKSHLQYQNQLMNKVRLALVFSIASAIFSSCSKQDVIAPVPSAESTVSFAGKNAKKSSPVATDWMNAIRAIVQSEGKNPPQASRIYAYTSLAMYEAIVPGMGGYKSMGGQIPGMNSLSKKIKTGRVDYPIAVNEAMHQVALQIFGTLKPQNTTLIEKLYTKYKNELAGKDKEEVIEETNTFVNEVVAMILQRATHDNFANTRSLVYQVPSNINNPSFWTPTSAVLNPLEPFWGTLQCFAMADGAACTINSTIPFSTIPGSAFYNQANEVITTTSSLTQNQKDIATWWADGGGTPTPPGHWLAIAGIMAHQKDLSLGATAQMYAMLSVAMADAFISCWNEKFRMNLLRPVSYIRSYVPGHQNWSSFIGTPPFPEYPSGHSVASGAAADILSKIFGKNVSFTDVSNVAFGYNARSFTSFSQAAQEAAMSRLYGGIHYREAIEKGLAQGQQVSKTLFLKLKFK